MVLVASQPSMSDETGRCPTCGSDAPEKRTYDLRFDEPFCDDPFHRATQETDPE